VITLYNTMSAIVGSGAIFAVLLLAALITELASLKKKFSDYFIQYVS